jgi:hypothetical protein
VRGKIKNSGHLPIPIPKIENLSLRSLIFSPGWRKESLLMDGYILHDTSTAVTSKSLFIIIYRISYFSVSAKSDLGSTLPSHADTNQVQFMSLFLLR